LENRFIYNKLEAILFEEMRRIDLLWGIVKWAIPFNIGTPPIEGSGYPMGGGRGFLPQNFLEGSLRNFPKNSKN
jgi:hypothetical protein